jgi:hypothetical protein
MSRDLKWFHVNLEMVLMDPTEDSVTIDISLAEIIEYQNIIAIRIFFTENLRPLGVSIVKRIVCYNWLVWGKPYDIMIGTMEANERVIYYSKWDLLNSAINGKPRHTRVVSYTSLKITASHHSGSGILYEAILNIQRIIRLPHYLSPKQT